MRRRARGSLGWLCRRDRERRNRRWGKGWSGRNGNLRCGKGRNRRNGNLRRCKGRKARRQRWGDRDGEISRCHSRYCCSGRRVGHAARDDAGKLPGTGRACRRGRRRHWLGRSRGLLQILREPLDQHGYTCRATGRRRRRGSGVAHQRRFANSAWRWFALLREGAKQLGESAVSPLGAGSKLCGHAGSAAWGGALDNGVKG